MNTRQKKKRLKKKYHIARFPKGMTVKFADRLMKEIKKEFARQLDMMVLYGDVHRVNVPKPSGLQGMWRAHMKGAI